MTRWTALPIRWRLTAAFAAAMALLISGLSGFVYARTGADLLDAVDAGLRSRAELLATDVQKHGPRLTGARPTLIESDEVFAQIATAAGRITQSSPLIAGILISVSSKSKCWSSRNIRSAARGSLVEVT